MWYVQIKNLRSWHPVPSLRGKYLEKQWKQWQALFTWAPKSLQIVPTVVGKKKKTLALWKKSYEKPYSTLKSRDIILPANVCIVKAMILPEIVSGCESWTIKKAEYQRIDAFKLCQTLFFWVPKSLQMVTAAMKLKDTYSLERKLWPT